MNILTSWTKVKKKTITAFVISAGVVVLTYSFYGKSFPALLLLTAAFLLAALIRYENIRSVGVVAVSTLLSLAMAELVVAWVVPAQKVLTSYDRASDFVKKGLTGLIGSGRLPEKGVYSSRKLSYAGEELYNVKYSIGNDGFRITSPQRQSDFRVNFFGCSWTIGDGLDDHETLPYFVNARIPNISVKNFGFHGWGAHNALAILQSNHDTRGTIAFFLTAPWHVPRSACKYSWTHGSPRFVLSANGRAELAGQCREKALSNLAQRLLKHSRLYKILQDVFENRQGNSDYDLYFAIVRQMGEISRSRHQKFIVGFIKAKEDFFGGSDYSNESFRQKLEGIADEVIDLTLADKVENLDKRFRIHELDDHPTAAANKIRADVLVNLFAKYGADLRLSIDQ